MGRRYSVELNSLNQTYTWALERPLEGLDHLLNASRNLSLIAVGSGGSLSAAQFAALLHQKTGKLSKGVTALGFTLSEQIISEAAVLVISAGGRNNDILSAFRVAASLECQQLIGLCMRTGSPLEKLSKTFQYSKCLCYNMPLSKDGFLATNSLLSFFVILIRAYQEIRPEEAELPKSLASTEEIRTEVEAIARPVIDKETLVVLYGGWSAPAAIDMESKFTEAALKNVQISDYRNFAHGRHYWLARRGNQTGVVAFITPSERLIAEKTLALIPKEIPILRISTDCTGPVGTLDVLIKVFHLVDIVGRAQGVDVGRPTVPSFGRRIYNLRFSPHSVKKGQETLAISRKTKYLKHSGIMASDTDFWRRAYQSFIKKIERTSFGGIVFDYDGTLCDTTERFAGPSQAIGKELLRMLSGGIIVGIATGRGKSVRIDLQKLIPKKFWQCVLIGYYNGSEIAALDIENRPNPDEPMHSSLQSVKGLIEGAPEFFQHVECEYRPNQITVIPTSQFLRQKIYLNLIDIVKKSKQDGVEVRESSHSFDILAPGVSKLHLVDECKFTVRERAGADEILCIGDKGEWPGNDHDLLSTPHSLSVDTVSSDPSSCWNISEAGHRGTQATLDYLARLEVKKGTLFFKNKKTKTSRT